MTELKVIGQEWFDCQSETCMHKRDCPNHTTAGDFRTEGGPTPIVKKIDGKYICQEKLSKRRFGALMLSRKTGKFKTYNIFD